MSDVVKGFDLVADVLIIGGIAVGGYIIYKFIEDPLGFLGGAWKLGTGQREVTPADESQKPDGYYEYMKKQCTIICNLDCWSKSCNDKCYNDCMIDRYGDTEQKYNPTPERRDTQNTVAVGVALISVGLIAAVWLLM